MSAARLELSLVDGLPSGRGHRRARVKSSHLIDIGRQARFYEIGIFFSSKSNRSTMATSTTFVAAALGAGYDLETLEQLLESRARALRTDAHSDATQPATTALASATSTTAQSTSPSGAPFSIFLRPISSLQGVEPARTTPPDHPGVADGSRRQLPRSDREASKRAGSFINSLATPQRRSRSQSGERHAASWPDLRHHSRLNGLN